MWMGSLFLSYICFQVLCTESTVKTTQGRRKNSGKYRGTTPDTAKAQTPQASKPHSKHTCVRESAKVSSHLFHTKRHLREKQVLSLTLLAHTLTARSESPFVSWEAEKAGVWAAGCWNHQLSFSSEWQGHKGRNCWGRGGRRAGGLGQRGQETKAQEKGVHFLL